MPATLNIAAYGEGILYPPDLEQNMTAIQNAGWTSLMVSLFQVDASENITFNGPIVSNGVYIGDAQWPAQLAQLKSAGTITTLLATFGGWDQAFYNIQNIYNANNNSFEGTQLQANCRVFRETFPAFDLVDIDAEYPDGPPQGNIQQCLVAFCQMWIDLGLGITFCPYQDMDLWTDCLVDLNTSAPGAVKWWNLQCYAGGAGNNPTDWANAITQKLPAFDTTGFILASDITRYWNGQDNEWEGDCPLAMAKFLAGFEGEPCIGGGFIWTIDQVIGYEAETHVHPDPGNCGNVGMTDYVNSIRVGLQG